MNHHKIHMVSHGYLSATETNCMKDPFQALHDHSGPEIGCVMGYERILDIYGCSMM